MDKLLFKQEREVTYFLVKIVWYGSTNALHRLSPLYAVKFIHLNYWNTYQINTFLSTINPFIHKHSHKKKGY